MTDFGVQLDDFATLIWNNVSFCVLFFCDFKKNIILEYR